MSWFPVDDGPHCVSAALTYPDGWEPPTLPTDPITRKKIPIATGVLDYFPDALAAIAEVSLAGNAQHMPGQSLHWDRSKSADHADSAIRHFIERGKRDSDGKRHTAKAAWRLLAMLQLEIEAERNQGEK